MSIVDGKGLVTWEGGLFTPDSQLLPRVRWAFAQIRAEGGSIDLNEAGRPFGVESDQYARNSQDTESGLSTVWFQWGRYKRGETPSAANPAGGAYASEHTQGIAIDCNANPTSLRAKYFPMVGLSNTIASESWHWAIRGPSQVDLSDYQYAGENFTPINNEEIDMAAEKNILDAIAALSTKVDQAIANADDADLMQVYYVENGVAIAIDPDDSRPPLIFRSPEDLQHQRDLKRVTRDAILLSSQELGQQLAGAQAAYAAKYPKKP